MPSLSGWGIGPFGLMPYGSGAVGAPSSTGFYIDNAILLSSHELLVTFSMPFNYEQAINPNSWLIRDDTDNFVILVYGIQPLNLNQVIVVLVSAAAPFAHEFSVGGAITSSTGDALDPPRASFFGVDLPADTSTLRKRDFDFANPFVTPDGRASTLRVTSGGDYAMETGRELITKLIIRRLIATPRDFIFYPDTYGVGLKVKAPIYLTDMARLRTQIVQSLAQETELDQIQVSLIFDAATSVMNINIRGRIRRTNAPFAIDVPLDTSTVSFT